MIDLSSLQKALESIASVGRGDLTFTVDNITITMRILSADEDISAQDYSRGTDESENGLRLLERYKRMVLAYSIKNIGGLDLESDPYVLTGKMTESGVPVREPKHVAVCRIIDGWPRVMTTALFQKYLELQKRVDERAEQAIVFDHEDLDAQIATAEKRLIDLKNEKSKLDLVKNNGAALSALANQKPPIQDAAEKYEGRKSPVPSSGPPPDTNFIRTEPPRNVVIPPEEEEEEDIVVPTIRSSVSEDPPHLYVPAATLERSEPKSAVQESTKKHTNPRFAGRR